MLIISSQSAPDGARDIVHEALRHRGRRAERIPALRGAPQTGSAIPIYLLTSVAIPQPKPLARANLVGWRFPIVGGEVPGFAMLIADADGPVYGGLSYGRMANRFLAAAQLADRRLGATVEKYSPRFLEIPSLRFVALWLAGPVDAFVVLIDGQRSTPPPLRLVTNIERRIGAAAAAAARRLTLGQTSIRV